MGREEELPSIEEFYTGRSLFVTGFTGFMGKALVEKLLRSCPGIGKIYVLLRNKRGLNPQQRLDKITNSTLFAKLRELRKDDINKIIPVVGELTEPELGISPEMKEEIKRDVSVFIHSAATVKFDDPLPYALDINVKGTREALQLAVQLPNLAVYVQISTAYSNSNRMDVEERLYPPPADWRMTLRIRDELDQSTVNVLTNKYLGDHNNTYVFSKALAEHVVNDYKDRLNILIFRPSIVTASFKEPLAGWVDNLNGPNGMSLAIGTGVLRVTLADNNVVPDFMPVDVAIKCLLVSTCVHALTRAKSLDVLNCCSKELSPTVSEYQYHGLNALYKYPYKYRLWRPYCTQTTSPLYFIINFYLIQLLPAVMVDAILRLVGQEPQLWKAQKRIYSGIMSLKFFILNQFHFHNNKLWDLNERVRSDEVETFKYAFVPTVEDKIWCSESSVVYLGRWLFKMDDKQFDRARKIANVQDTFGLAVKIGFYLYLVWKVYSLQVIPSVFNSTVRFLTDF